MKKLTLSLVVSALISSSAVLHAGDHDTGIKSQNSTAHSAFKNDDSQLQAQFYRSLRLEDWQASGLSRTEILTVLGNIQGQGELVDLENHNSAGFWTYEFSRSAEMELEQAKQISATNTAAKVLAYNKVSALYLIASYPNLKRPNELLALENAVAYYLKSAALNDELVNQVKLPLVDGATIPGILHTPKQGSNFPAVMLSGGVDKTLIEHKALVNKLVAKGYAVLTFDMPGAGLDYKHALTVGNEDASHQAAFKFLANNAQIDKQRIGVLSSSGSGTALVEFALNQPQLQAVVARCALVDGPLRNAKALKFIPSMSADSLIARLGGDAGDKAYLAKNAAKYSLVTKGYFDGKAKIDTPLLAINTNKDPVAMPDDVRKTAALSSQGEAKFFGKGGHCPDAPEAEDYVIKFLTKHI